MDEKYKRPTRTFAIEIYDGQFWRGLELYVQITKLAKEGKSIPPDLILEADSLFVAKINKDVALQQEKIEVHTRQVMQRFSRLKHNFTIIKYEEPRVWAWLKGEKRKKPKQRVVYSLENMLSKLFNELFKDDNCKNWKRSEYIDFIYQFIKDYNEGLGHFKSATLTGFIVWKLGFYSAYLKTKHPTTDQLFQSVRKRVELYSR